MEFDADSSLRLKLNLDPWRRGGADAEQEDELDPTPSGGFAAPAEHDTVLSVVPTSVASVQKNRLFGPGTDGTLREKGVRKVEW